MILAEKLSQKLHNLRSKQEIKDFFIFFDEYRNFGINFSNGNISSIDSPNHLCENSEGNFLIVWNDEHISKGKINSEAINNFEDFLNYTKATKVPHPQEVFIPERGIYPMVITYSKPLADMIDIPEYLLKIADVTGELDKMVKSKIGSSKITVKEGVRYAYSSRDLDEYYPYTQFSLTKQIADKIKWKIQTSDIFPMLKFQELFSFMGDTYNFIKSSDEYTAKKNENLTVILPPNIFQQLFNEQVIENLNAEKVLKNNSPFSQNDFNTKAKHFGTLSISYDPLINHRVGTYKFTSYGLKPQRNYFIKFGKLNSYISNSINYKQVEQALPSIEINNISNIKFEGIKKTSFNEIRRGKEPFIFAFNNISDRKVSYFTSLLYFKNALFMDGSNVARIDHFDIKVNLQELISSGRLELVEFTDGQLGCKISPEKS
jgi:predicted Zn-dependent protease